MPTDTLHGTSYGATTPPNPDNLLGAPDGIYSGDGTNTGDVTVAVHFTPPGGALNGTQTWSVTLRKSSSGGNDPEISVTAGDGSNTFTLTPPTTVTDATTVVSGDFPASSIAHLTNGWDRLILTLNDSGGSPSKRRSVEVDAITVGYQTQAAQTHQTTGALAATADLTATSPTPLLRRHTFEDSANEDDSLAQGVAISGTNSGDSATNDAFTIVSGTTVYDTGNLDGTSVLGYRSAQSDTGAAGTYNVFGWREAGHGHTSAALSAWIKWSGPTTAGTGNENAFLTVRDSGDVAVALVRWSTSTGVIEVRDGASGYTTVTTLAASANWYRFDFFADWGTPALKARVIDSSGTVVAEAIDPAPDFTGFTDEAWDLRAGHEDSNAAGTVVNFDDLQAGYGATDYLDAPRPAPYQVGLGSYSAHTGAGTYYAYPSDNWGSTGATTVVTYPFALGSSVSERVRISYGFPASALNNDEQLDLYRDSDSTYLGTTGLLTPTPGWSDMEAVEIDLAVPLTGSDSLRIEQAGSGINWSGPLSFYLNDPATGPVTGTAALAGTAGLTAEAQVVRSTTGALGATAGITLSETLLLPVTGDLGATAGLTGTADTTTPPVTFTGALAGSAGLTAEAGVVKSTQVTMAATGLLGASGALTLQGQATLAATGNLTAGSASLVTLDGSLAATGTLQGVASREVALQGSLAASAGFSAQAGVVKSTQASMASVASLDTSGVKTLAGQADLAATGTLSATGSGASTHLGEVTLAATGALTGEAQVVRSGAVALGAAANLTGAPSVTMATSGALAALAGLTAQPGGAKTTTVVQAFSGALSASGLILKPSTGGSTATADLAAEAQVIRAGTATLAATSLMALQAQRTLEASADLLATGSTVVLVTAAPPITLRPLGMLPESRSLLITPRPVPGTASHSSAITPRPTP